MSTFWLVTTEGFQQRLRRQRLKAGLSQEGLAARTDLSARTIARLEADGNTSPPNRSTVRLLAMALDVTVEELLANGGQGEAA